MRDFDVRAALREELAVTHRGDRYTKIIEEMGVWSGTVRIDLAVVNGELTGYEIKSDRDSLERLPLQADIYSRVFDKLFLVVGERHLKKAESHVPDWWGIRVARKTGDGVDLSDFRSAATNPNPDPYLVAEMLSKIEAIAVLEANGMSRGWKSKQLRAIHMRLATELELGVLARFVRDAIKSRPGTSEGQIASSQGAC